MKGNGDGDGRRKRKRGESEAQRQTHTQTERSVAGEEGGRLTSYRMREDQKRRQPHHTTQHDTIRHTETTIEIGTGRDGMRHDREWRCMAMAMGGEREREERMRHRDRQTEVWRERREGGRETYRLLHERGSEEETATPHHTTRYDTQEQR
jgi:hypothetical protein